MDGVFVAEPIHGRKHPVGEADLVDGRIGENPQAGGRREGRGPDQARIIGQAEPAGRFAPELIEHELPFRVPFEIQGQAPDQPTVGLDQEMAGEPAPTRGGAARIFQELEPSPLEKGRLQVRGQGVPAGGVHLAHAMGKTGGVVFLGNGHWTTLRPEDLSVIRPVGPEGLSRARPIRSGRRWPSRRRRGWRRPCPGRRCATPWPRPRRWSTGPRRRRSAASGCGW